ncbi:MAG: hypothetical protein JXQ67_11480 [Campylobacterales bacterium]|nr:hypothetical protein [Campylobacterales bacterium]
MNTLVYLDQNIISDLRDRKLFETKNKELMLLKSILMRPDIEVIYSHVTLDEIGQIHNTQYFHEHYRVLEQLEAKYIDPINKKLIDDMPYKVALNYVKNKRASYNTPYPYLEKTIEDISRKISGHPINKTPEEIGNDTMKYMSLVVDYTIQQINLLDVNDYEEPMKSLIINMQENIPRLLKEFMSNSNPFIDSNNLPLGTKVYREHELTKKLMSSEPSVSELVIELQERWQNDKDILNSTFVNNLVEKKILYAYTQLNWFGYHADDFDKVKKNKDRFNASQNDSRHASYAHRANYLISNDRAFCKKTIVSYKFADVKTLVCTSKSFLKEYGFNQFTKFK